MSPHKPGEPPALFSGDIDDSLGEDIEHLVLNDLQLDAYDGPAFAGIDFLLDLLLRARMARNMAIIGTAGAGKTRVALKVIHHVRKSLGSKRHKYAVIYVRLRARSTVASFAEQVLSLLEDPHFARMSAPQAEGRIIDALKGRRVYVIVIDESHHLLQGKGEKGTRALTAAFKNISDMGKVILVFVGTPDFVAMRDTNSEFRRRFLRTVDVYPMDWTVPAHQAIFRKILHEADKQLGFMRLANLDANDEFAFRLYQAFSGIIGMTLEFLFLAAQYVRDQGRTQLMLEDLAEFYRENYATNRPGFQDPFARSSIDNWEPVKPGFWAL